TARRLRRAGGGEEMRDGFRDSMMGRGSDLSPKGETRRPREIRNQKAESDGARAYSCAGPFGLLSAFGFRPSGFPRRPMPQLNRHAGGYLLTEALVYIGLILDRK